MNAQKLNAVLLLPVTLLLWVAWFRPETFSFLELEPASLSSRRFEGSIRYQLPTAGPLAFQTGTLEIRYPAGMLENQTRSVELRYTMTQQIVNSDRLGRADIVADISPPDPILHSFDGNLEYELNSSGFEIGGEKKMISKAPVSLPIKHIWTITPKAEGTHDLLLRFKPEPGESMLQRLWSTKATLAATINGKAIDADGGGWYALPITVSTYLGVSRKTQAIALGVCTLASFVLMWPVVIAFIKRRLGWSASEDDPPAKTTGEKVGDGTGTQAGTSTSPKSEPQPQAVPASEAKTVAKPEAPQVKAPIQKITLEPEKPMPSTHDDGEGR